MFLALLFFSLRSHPTNTHTEWCRGKEPAAKPFLYVPVLLFCGPNNFSRVTGHHNPKAVVFVTQRDDEALEFATFERRLVVGWVDWALGRGM